MPLLAAVTQELRALVEEFQLTSSLRARRLRYVDAARLCRRLLDDPPWSERKCAAEVRKFIGAQGTDFDIAVLPAVLDNFCSVDLPADVLEQVRAAICEENGQAKRRRQSRLRSGSGWPNWWC